MKMPLSSMRRRLSANTTASHILACSAKFGVPVSNARSRNYILRCFANLYVGDGDGDKGADYHEKPGPLAPLETRWRLYQSCTGDGKLKYGVNEPPKYVLLDDRAAYEVFNSDVPGNKRTEWWSHDFASPGFKIRARRPHRGRGAVGDVDAEGDDKYHFGRTGTKNEKYYFTGEKNYNPVIYRSAHSAPSEPTKHNASSTPVSSKSAKPKRLGHNQHTRKDQLVKYGAPHQGTTYRNYRPRINAFLHRDPSPELPFDKAKLYGRAPHHAPPDPILAGKALESVTRHSRETSVGLELEEGEEEGMWMQQDDGRPKKRRKFYPAAPMPGAEIAMQTGKEKEGDEIEDDELFPTRAKSPDIGMEFLRDVSDDEGEHGEEDDVDTPKLVRKKLPQQLSYFDRMAAQQEQADDEEAEIAEEVEGSTTIKQDSGSYASQLERALEEARKTIKKQENDIDELQEELTMARDRITELEEDMAASREV